MTETLETVLPAPERTSAVIEAREVLAAVANLPRPYRDVVLAVDVVGCSYAEAAEALGVPIGTVMSRLYRGRRRVIEAIDGEGKAPEDARPNAGAEPREQDVSVLADRWPSTLPNLPDDDFRAPEGQRAGADSSVPVVGLRARAQPRCFRPILEPRGDTDMSAACHLPRVHGP